MSNVQLALRFHTGLGRLSLSSPVPPLEEQEMTVTTKPRMDVVKREEKEAKLTAFIASNLAANPASTQPWLLVARSAESPVVKALDALAPALAAAGRTVTALLTQASPGIADGTAMPALKFAGEVRVTHDIRLLDAHEILCLDGDTSWIGDCMRREPAKRDAYECYAANCAETADWSRKAFDRLWAKAEVASPVRAMVAEEATSALQVDDCVASSVTQIPSTVLVSTRH